MINRRTVLTGASALATGMAPIAALADTITLPIGNGERPLVKYPQKRPMIGLTARPPQLETPFSVFNEDVITPNDAFFVRYHLAGIPLEIDPDTYTIDIKGKVDKPMKLTPRGPEAHARRSSSSRSTSARATAAASSSRAWRAASSATARWAMRGGAACRSRRCLTQAGVQSGRQAGRVQRPRHAGDRQDARLREGARDRPRDRRRGHAGVCR